MKALFVAAEEESVTMERFTGFLKQKDNVGRESDW